MKETIIAIIIGVLAANAIYDLIHGVVDIIITYLFKKIDEKDPME